MKKEIWECNECGSPCRVELQFSDHELPAHLKGQTRFRNRACPCDEQVAFWKDVTEQGDSADSISKCPYCVEYEEIEKFCGECGRALCR